MTKRIAVFLLILFITIVEHSSAMEDLLEERNGRVKTLNKNGWMNTELDKYTVKFLEFAEQQNFPVLDIGAAFGIATKAALKRGIKVIANDIEPKHLKILQETTPCNLRNNLTLLSGAFPNEANLGELKVGAILASRVLHFFSGENLELAAKKMYDIIVSGGRVFVIADSPYTKAWSSYIPIYEAKKKAGYKFPGIIDEPKAINDERAKNLPRILHRLDPEVLSRVFSNAGFKVITSKFFNMSIYPEDMRYDGKECVVLIADKIAAP
jgi:polyketide synthase PksL